jgi:hypothetical protein
MSRVPRFDHMSASSRRNLTPRDSGAFRPLRSDRRSIAALLLPLLAACSSSDGPLQERADAFQWSAHVPAGATLHLRNLNGGIEVAVGADDTVRVVADVAWRRGTPDEEIRFEGLRQGDDAVVCAIWGVGRCGVEDYAAKIDLSDHATDAKVRFRVTVPRGVRLDLKTVNGGVTAAAGAPVEARTINGDVTIATAVGPVRGETTNGSVDLRMSSLAGTDSIIARTLNGNAFVYLPEGIDAAVDLGVTSGSVSSDFPITVTGTPNRRALVGTLGAGGRGIRIRTLNGSAALRRLDAEGRSAPR